MKHLKQTILTTICVSGAALAYAIGSPQPEPARRSASDSLKLPVTLAPTQDEESLFTIIDANGDGVTWQEGFANGGVAWWYSYSMQNAGNDWLILPAIDFPSTLSTYEFSMQYMNSDYCAEKYEIYLGAAPTAEAMTQMIVGPTTTQPGSSVCDASYSFTVPAPGAYYIGIHCISDTPNFSFYTFNFNVKEGKAIEVVAPSSPSDLKVTAADKGELYANVEFKLPRNRIDGSSLSSNVEIQAEISSPIAKKTVSGLPGAVINETIETQQGDNTISVVAVEGTARSSDMSTNLFTGIDVPGPLSNIKGIPGPDHYSAVITWEPPTTGGNGYYCPPTGITYYQCEYINGTWTPAKKLGVDVYECTVSMPEGAPMANYQWAIAAENAAGMCVLPNSVITFIGKPYDLPMVETWSGGLSYTPIRWCDEEDVDMKRCDPSDLGYQFEHPSGRSHTMTCYSEKTGWFQLPTFSTKGSTDAGIVAEMYINACDNIEVYAETYGVERVKIFDMSTCGLDEGYQRIEMKLPAELQDKPWVDVTFEVSFTPILTTFSMPRYEVKELSDNDLSVSLIEGARILRFGDKATYTGSVINMGRKAAVFTGGVWEIKDCEGNTISKMEESKSVNLEAGQSENISFELNCTPNMVDGIELSYTSFANDDNNANNTSAVSVVVPLGMNHVVTDLKGEKSENSIQLTWSAPRELEGFEDFETEVPFIPGQKMLGSFIAVDLDAVPNIGFGSDIPGAYEPTAFNVFKPADLTSLYDVTNILPVDGEQYIMACCPAPVTFGDNEWPAANDWLISPEVISGSDVSMKVSSMNANVETIQILYSTGSTYTKDFVLIEEKEISNFMPAWEDLTFTLPADAKRFAIRYISQMKSAVVIDAIKYSPKAADLTVTGYNVLKSEDAGEYTKIGETAATEYVDNAYSDLKGTSYVVVPVLSDGSLGIDSNEVVYGLKSGAGSVLTGEQAVISVNRNIFFSGFDNAGFVIADLSGIVVSSGVVDDGTSVAVQPGIYVVNVDNKVIKVVVK